MGIGDRVDAGAGTGHYGDYARDHVIRIEGKPVLRGSSDPAFRGDPTRHNPEDLLIASLSSCHMLWYLHLCAEAGLVVERYRDQAVGPVSYRHPRDHETVLDLV